MISNKDLFKFNTNFLSKNKDFNPNIQLLKIIENLETGAYLTIGIYNKTLILSFRGTEITFQDIFSDIMFFKKSIPYNNTNKKIKVHAGFLSQYLSIRETLHKYLKNKIFFDDILIIGHSLGAALSTLCILDLNYNFYDIKIKGIVFGSPRVGNIYFQKIFDRAIKDFTNIQNINDLVTKIPMKWLGFTHVGTLQILDKPKFPYISIRKHLDYDNFL